MGSIAVRARQILPVLTLGIAGCGSEPSPVPVVPPPLHDVFLRDDAVVGCYEVTSLEWDDPKARGATDSAPPQRFRLRNTLARPQSHTIVPRAPTPFTLSSWRITIANELEATWSTGEIWVTVTLRQRSTDGVFHGRVVPASDTGPEGGEEGSSFASSNALADQARRKAEASRRSGGGGRA